jgi:DUF4097 and DUF4098 domain-containing protein YvlB
MKTQPVCVAVLAAFTLMAGLAAPASAEEFKLPDKHPVISVTYPNSWKPEEIDRGVQGQTDDTAVYLSVEASKSEKGMNEIIDSSFDMFKEHKVEIDKSSKKVNKMEIAGVPAEELLFTGKDEDGPTTISITTFQVGDTVIVISYWASTEAEAKYHPAIAKIIGSIQPLK